MSWNVGQGGIDALGDEHRIFRGTGYITAVLFFAVLLFCGVSEATAEQTQHILIVNSYHKEFEWTDDQTSAIKDVLTGAIENLELYVEYMDTKRIYSPEYLGHLLDVFHLKYGKIKLDGVVATDDNALQFVMKYHEEVFSGASVSFCGINDYHPGMFEGKSSFTGVIEVLDIKPTIDLAMRLHPDIRTVYVITDNTPTGKGQKRDVEAVSKQYNGVEFKNLSGEDYSHLELLAKLRTLPSNSVVLLTVWLRDKTDAYIPVAQGGGEISSASTVPVYGIITMYLEHGIVGGKLLSSRAQGSSAAELMLRVLGGEQPRDIGVITESVNPYMFDFNQLQRWHIDILDLPEASLVLNEPESFYYRHRKLIWATITIVIVESVLIVALFVTIASRKQAEAEREKLLKKLETKNEELQSIVYISSHDLKTPLVNINGFSNLLKEHSDQLKVLIEKQNLSDDVKKEIASLIDKDIHQDLDIISTSIYRIERLIDGLLKVSMIGVSEVNFRKIDMNKMVSEILAIVKYQTDENNTEINIAELPSCHADEDMLRQVFTNLVDNAIKYFKPKQKGLINITGHTKDGRSIYCVEDNGIGIRKDYQDKVFDIYYRLDPNSPVEGEGLGLTIIRRILDLHDGNIWVESEENKGSKFFVSLPKGG